jgi:hypothetical protein
MRNPLTAPSLYLPAFCRLPLPDRSPLPSLTLTLPFLHPLRAVSRSLLPLPAPLSVGS